MSIPSSSTVVAVFMLAVFKRSNAQKNGFGPCPASVGLQNGGFENGEIAPWTLVAPGASPTGLTYSLVSSGGYQSQHAVEVKVPPSNLVEWALGADPGQLCVGDNYTVGFAINWIGLGNHSHLCYAGAGDARCSQRNSTPSSASSTAGWMLHNYTCQASETSENDFIINVECAPNYSTPNVSTNLGLPAFTFLVDDLSFERIQTPTTTTVEGSPTGVPSASSTPSEAHRIQFGGFFSGPICSILLVGPMLYQALASI